MTITVYIVIFDKAAYKISEKLFFDIAEYIDDNYVDAHTDYRREEVDDWSEDINADYQNRGKKNKK